MQSRFTYKLKNRVLLLGMPVLAILFYFLAFKKTYDAIKLHYQLNRQISQTDNLSYNPKYSADKLKRMNVVLNQYKADTIVWREDFWMLTSGMASARSIAVIYDQNNRNSFKAEKNNSAISDVDVSFIGEYRNIVQLIDSLEHNRKVGHLSALEMTLVKDALNKEKKILVKANFKVVSK